MVVRESSVLPVEIKPFVGVRFTCPSQIFNLFQGLLSLPMEAFIVLHLDNQHQISAMTTVSIGTLNSTLIHAREVFRTAVANLTAGIICIHHHPSGEPDPSPEDRTVTQKLKKAGEVLGIPVIDHVIIARRGYYSFAAAGLL